MAISAALTPEAARSVLCLLYTSDAADEEDSVDLGGRRIIKKNPRTSTERAASGVNAALIATVSSFGS